jgi:hypothetical protein
MSFPAEGAKIQLKVKERKYQIASPVQLNEGVVSCQGHALSEVALWGEY